MRPAVTNDAGIYSFPSFVPGNYTLRAEKSGFRSVIRNGIDLQVQQAARIDIELQVGEVSESVQVREDAALLATDNATVGTVIENQGIVELPLNGRNYLQLVSLAPNVSTGFSSQGQAVSRQGGFRAGETIAVGGQRTNFNHYTLDGVENTDPNFNACRKGEIGRHPERSGNAILGSWQLGSIVTWRSGFPINPFDGINRANTNIGNDRPNASGISRSLANPSTAEWFNVAASTLQRLYAFGNAGRNTVIGPPGFYWDFSAPKEFRLPKEGHAVQFRWEAFNVLNHPAWGLPNVTLTNPEFGRITSTSGNVRQMQFALKFNF